MSDISPIRIRTRSTARESLRRFRAASQEQPRSLGASGGAPVRVVIDCDTGVDDTMAVFYGLLAPEVEIVGLTCVWGNISVDLTTRNTLRLLEMLDRPEIPVARGADKPLVYPKWPPPEQPIHGTDGQGNTNLPAPTLKAVDETASELIIRLAYEHPGELTLVPTGPLTNVATAVLADPEIAKLYKGVVLMGGAFTVRGNASRFGEANIWHDPEAAQVVFDAGWPVTAVGLDVTDSTMIPGSLLDDLRDSGTIAGKHLHAITQNYLDIYGKRRGRRECAMHDALTLGIAADPTLVLESRKVRVDVELNGTHTRGMTVGDFRPWMEYPNANVTVVLEVDRQRFIDRWAEVIRGA